MRHGKNTFKIGRTVSHRRCLLANMLKSLIEHERIETTLRKAKALRVKADQMITLAKEDTLASRRRAIAELMIRFNHLTPWQWRMARKEKKTFFYNLDRKVIKKLFGELKQRFEKRKGGYTRIIKESNRVGDNAPRCYIEYLK